MQPRCQSVVDQWVIMTPRASAMRVLKISSSCKCFNVTLSHLLGGTNYIHHDLCDLEVMKKKKKTAIRTKSRFFSFRFLTRFADLFSQIPLTFKSLLLKSIFDVFHLIIHFNNNHHHLWIQHYVIKFVSDMRQSVVFSVYSGFLHQ